MRGMHWMLAAGVVAVLWATRATAQIPQMPNMFQQGQSAGAGASPAGGGWYGLYENTILTPAFSRNDAFLNLNGGVGLSPQFEWAMTYSPRVEAGFMARGEGLGLAGRYWHFDATASRAGLPGDNRVDFSVTPDIAIAAPDLIATHSLRFEQIDGEVTARRGNIVAIGGARYLKMTQTYAASAPGDAGVTIVHSFTGVGPTVGVEGRQGLGATKFALFANGRASILFGKRDLTASDLVGGDSYTRNSAHAIFPTTQVQVGGEWLRPMGERGSVIVRAALEAQYLPSGGAGFRAPGGVGGDPLADPLASGMGFFGASVGIGLSW